MTQEQLTSTEHADYAASAERERDRMLKRAEEAADETTVGRCRGAAVMMDAIARAHRAEVA